MNFKARFIPDLATVAELASENIDKERRTICFVLSTMRPLQPAEETVSLSRQFGIFLSRKAKKEITNSNNASTVGLEAALHGTRVQGKVTFIQTLAV